MTTTGKKKKNDSFNTAAVLLDKSLLLPGKVKTYVSSFKVAIIVNKEAIAIRTPNSPNNSGL